MQKLNRKKVLQYIWKTAAILIGLVLVLYLAAAGYIYANKKKIIRQVTEDLSQKLDGKVTIGDANLTLFRNFPKISVLLKDISVTDTLFSQHRHPFLAAKEVYISLSLMRLIRREPPVGGLRIREGSVYLFIDTSGYTNTYLLHPKKKANANKGSNGEVSLRAVELNNVRITVDDRRRAKLHDFVVTSLDMEVDDEDSSIAFSTQANILVKSLGFNLARGVFLKEAAFAGDFEMKYAKASKLLSFDDIDIRLSGQRFNLSGRFDLGGDLPQFSLSLHVRNALYDDIKKLLPHRIDSSLSIITLDKPLNADATITGPLKGGDPLINASWKVEQGNMTTPFLDFTGASFSGSYTNEVVKGLPRNDPNSKVLITGLSADWHGLPLTAQRIEIMNLLVPVLTCDLQSHFPLTDLNEVIGAGSLQLNAGEGTLQLTYKGPIVRNNNTNSFINGNIAFRDGKILYAPRNVELTNVNGLLVFKNSDVTVEALKCNVLGNNFVMNGEAKNLLTLINTEPNKVALNWSIYTPSLNLGAFTYLLKNRSKVTKKGAFSQMAAKIDDLLEQSRIEASLKADGLVYHHFEAGHAEANITLLQDRYVINNVSMNSAGGHVSLSGAIVNQQDNYHTTTIKAALSGVDVKRLFTAFDNFGQDGITAKSLNGTLSTSLSAAMIINNDGKVVPSTIHSTVDFSLKNGALINYEPIKKLQNFILRNRNFDDIRFAELKDRLEIKGGEIKINRMEIQSTVLTMFVEGLYSPKGATDLSIQVPLNNLKKRDSTYKPENIGTDKKGGHSIFLRGRPGSDGNVQFKLDLFNKFKKEKEEGQAAETDAKTGEASDSTAPKKQSRLKFWKKKTEAGN